MQSPEIIAQTIFSTGPKKPFSFELSIDNQELLYLHDILLIILFEGLEIFAGNLSEIEVDQFCEEHISILNPWFHSFGFNIILWPQDNNQEYCTILIKNDSNQDIFIQHM